MKKLLSIVMCIVFLVGIVPANMLSVMAAESLDTISPNTVWNASWNSSTSTKYAYLTVTQTGYYNLSLKDNSTSGYLSCVLNDLDAAEDEYPWWRSYASLYCSNGGKTEENNVYLIAGNLYEVKFTCGYYDEDVFVNLNANVSFLVEKTDYVPTNIILGQYTNLTTDYNTTYWMEFITTASGDYLLETNQTFDYGVEVYEKVSGTYQKYASFYDTQSIRFRLKANTRYILKTYCYEDEARLVRFKVSKAANNISRIDIVQPQLLLAHNGYFYDDGASLYWSNIEDGFAYKVTYSNGKSETLSYTDLYYCGIEINGVQYVGGIYKYNGESFFKMGTQPVTISYMNDIKNNSTIYITSYLKWCSNLNAANDYENMWIEYEGDGEYTYYWKIKPDETNNYEFYSYDWDEIYSDFTIFDANNQIVARKDGWNLKAGQEYCLRVTYSYAYDCYGDVAFSLQPHRDHVHTPRTTVTKATLSKDGAVVSACSACGNVAARTTINRVKTIKLSATSYTYNGKAKKPGVTIKDSKGKTISSKYYTVKYASGRKNVGKYKVTVTFKGNYSGTKTLYFTINPVKTKISKITSAKKKLTVTIQKKTKQVTGYEIQYSTSKKFTKTTTKIKTIKSYKTIKSVLSKLKAKKTYYVRVRTYKTVSGKKYYSGWSVAKKIKTK